MVAAAATAAALAILVALSTAALAGPVSSLAFVKAPTTGWDSGDMFRPGSGDMSRPGASFSIAREKKNGYFRGDVFWAKPTPSRRTQVPPGPRTPPCKGCLVYTTNAPSRAVLGGEAMHPGASCGHAVHVCAAARPRDSCLCHWGGRLLRCGAGVRWAKLDPACGLGAGSWELGVWSLGLGRQATWERRFKSRRRSSIPTAAQRRRLGEGGGHEKANGFLPPWRLIVQS
jgi:hypothetical protein